MKISAIAQSPTFGQKPNAKQMKVYTNSLNQGLELLGKQVDLILHNASAPAVSAENTGIGSLFSKTTVTKLFPFLKEHGISGIQQEPNGLRKAKDNSPYAPEASAKNIFMIPLEKLASDEYGNILSKATFNKIVANNPDKNDVDYDYVRKAYNVALKEAFNNGKNSKEFIEFKQQNEEKYEQSAIFHLLNELYDGKKWSSLDSTMYSTVDEVKANDRINELKSKYKNDYDFYIFNQMILEKENEKSNKLARETGVKIIGDSPVAQTAVDEWVNQKLFLKGKAIGCPPDYFSKDGQRWGFKYYDPEKIFNKDGSLGEAGEVLKKKYEDYFASFPGGIRIDHVIGLIDPFIYTTSAKKMTPQNSGRIYSVEGKYKKNSLDEYAALLTKIIIPAAEKFGLNKSSIICEDLGDATKPVQEIMKKLELSGISVTQFDHRGATTPQKNTIMIGSHDNQSFLEFVEGIFKNTKDKGFLRKTKLLAEDTAPMGATTKEKKQYREDIRKDKAKFIAASFAELFTSPARRVQIFFTDFFGIAKTYNRPGTKTGNWSLRLGENFESDYYKAVSEGKAPNFAKAIATALRQRGLDKGHEDLMRDLDNSAKILGEG